MITDKAGEKIKFKNELNFLSLTSMETKSAGNVTGLDENYVKLSHAKKSH